MWMCPSRANGEADGWRGAEVDGDELDPAQVEMGRGEQLEFIVNKVDIFAFGTYEGGGRVERKQAADDNEMGRRVGSRR